MFGYEVRRARSWDAHDAQHESGREVGGCASFIDNGDDGGSPHRPAAVVPMVVPKLWFLVSVGCRSLRVTH